MSLFETLPPLEEEIALLRQWKNSYYNGQPEVSDEVYDKKEEEIINRLNLENPTHEFLKEIGSPTPNDGVWPKFKHPTTMGSLGKARSEKVVEDFTNWATDKDNSFHLSEKIDGCTIVAVYKNGELITLATRGDGTIGDDITKNAKDFKNFPLKLKEPLNCIFRGEATIRVSDFKKYGTGFKNPRNATSGKLRDTGKDSLKEQVNFWWFEVISCEGRTFKEWGEHFSLFNKLGLNTPNNWDVSTDSLWEIYKTYVESARQDLDYWIDGLVCRVSNIHQFEELGVVGNHPKGAIALKFPQIAKETSIIGCEINRGLQGRFTPVAIIAPVEIDGTLISRATLNNYDWIKEKDLAIGDTVEIIKGGDIIPKIIKKTKNGAARTIISEPTICDVCNAPLKKFGAYLECDNELCEGQAYGLMLKWVTTLDIKGLGPAQLKKLINCGITDPAKLHSVTETEIAEALNSEVLAEKIKRALDSKKNTTLTLLLGGLNIQSLGMTNAQRLATKFKNIENLLETTKEEIAAIDGIGSVNSDKIYNGLQTKKDLIQEISKTINIKKSDNGKLTGKSFCITGVLSSGKTRKELVEVIETNGGEVKNDVGRGLTYLITDSPNSGSSKNQKADKYGVLKITEKEFETLLASR